MTRWNIAATALVLAMTLAGCQEDVAAPAEPQADTGPRIDDRTGPPAETMPTPAEAEQSPMITIAAAEPPHLVDAAGQALYVLEDNHDGSRCDEECESAWPPSSRGMVPNSPCTPGPARDLPGPAAVPVRRGRRSGRHRR